VGLETAAVASGQQPQPPAAAAAAIQPTRAEAAAQAPGEPTDMLEERLRATLAWLERSAPETHSVQLLGSENAQQLRDYLSYIAKTIEISDLYVYRTVARQKPFLTVLYGSFGSREAAQNALDRLPPPLKAFRPYLRTVQGIREEMSRNKTL
jgi:DamX protein